MAYLKTILTYHMPSVAEVDKSLLESHGITVCLLNANESRNELGAPFHIQLQVPGEEVNEAVTILRQFNPQRFGSAENVKQIERELVRTLARLVVTSVLVGAAIYGFTSDGYSGDRVTNALVGGVILGPLLGLLLGKFKRKA